MNVFIEVRPGVAAAVLLTCRGQCEDTVTHGGGECSENHREKDPGPNHTLAGARFAFGVFSSQANKFSLIFKPGGVSYFF